MSPSSNDSHGMSALDEARIRIAQERHDDAVGDAMANPIPEAGVEDVSGTGAQGGAFWVHHDGDGAPLGRVEVDDGVDLDESGGSPRGGSVRSGEGGGGRTGNDGGYSVGRGSRRSRSTGGSVSERRGGTGGGSESGHYGQARSVVSNDARGSRVTPRSVRSVRSIRSTRSGYASTDVITLDSDSPSPDDDVLTYFTAMTGDDEVCVARPCLMQCRVGFDVGVTCPPPFLPTPDWKLGRHARPPARPPRPRIAA